MERAAHAAQLDEGVVLHDHEGPLVEAQPALAVVLQDGERAHAVAHRTAAIEVGRQRVGEGARLARDGEALGAVTGGDIVEQLAAGGELLLLVPGPPTAAVAGAPVASI